MHTTTPPKSTQTWTTYIFILIFILSSFVLLHYHRERQIAEIHWLGNYEVLDEKQMEKVFHPYSNTDKIGYTVSVTKIKQAMLLIAKNPIIESATFELLLLPSQSQTSDSTQYRLTVNVREKFCQAIVEDQVENFRYGVDKHLGMINLKSQKNICSQRPIIIGSFYRTPTNVDDPILRQIVRFLINVKDYSPNLWQQISELKFNADQNITIDMQKLHLSIELPSDLHKIDIAKLFACVAYYKSQRMKRGIIDMRSTEIILLPEV